MKYKYLLILRYALINIVGFIFLFVLHTQGYLTNAIKADVTNMILIIITLFLVGFISATFKTLWISKELNAVGNSSIVNSLSHEYLNSIKKSDSSSKINIVSSIKMKISTKINHIKFISNTLVVLGLIGTVVGFIIALSGVDGTISSNPEEVSKMVTTLIQGMSVALYTTLAGSICSVWLNICFHILSTGSNNLLSKIIGEGEKS